MKIKHQLLYLCISVFILCSSCSPILIKYLVIANNNSSIGKLENATNPILFVCEITQEHFPNKKVQNFVKISILNLSNDTVNFDLNNFIKLATIVNVIDTNQLKELLSHDFKSHLLPQGELSYNYQYWSKSFEGSIKTLVHILSKEKIEIKITSKKGKNLFENFILLSPDLGKFKKSKHSL